MRKWSKWLVAAVMAFPLLTIQTVYGAACTSTSTNLTVTGKSTSGNVTADVDEPFTLSYDITPAGEFVDTTDRQPINLILVLDTSLSMDTVDVRNNPSRLNALKSAATTLVNSIANLAYGDKIGIVKFNSNASTVQSLTTNIVAVRNAINGLSTPNSSTDGLTNIQGGLLQGLSALTTNGTTTGTPVANPNIVFITDGMATTYNGASQSSRTNFNNTSNLNTSRSKAEDAADAIRAKGIPVYTVALGPTTSSGSDITQQVDPELLAYISSPLAPLPYRASNTAELNNVFSNIQNKIIKPGSISNIKIRQPLPDAGFQLAPGDTSGAYIETVGGVRYVVIPVPDIEYPWPIPVQPVKANVSLVQTTQLTSDKTYSFANGTVTANNACSNPTSGSVVTNVSVTVLKLVEIMDKWGNVYRGDRLGGVTRYKNGRLDQPQFEIPYNSSTTRAVTALSLSDGDTTLKASYKGTSTTASWSLLPTAPTSMTIYNYTGTTSIEKSKASDLASSYANPTNRGPGMIAIAGSKNQLPTNTVYYNEDFRANYISHYEYSVGASTVYKFVDKDAKSPFDESGLKMTVNGRADTAAISGSDLVGATITRYATLDSVRPDLPTVDSEDFSTTLKNGYTFTVTDFMDTPSGVSKAEWLNGTTVGGSLSNPALNAKLTLAAVITDIDKTNNVYVKVTDKVGLEAILPLVRHKKDETNPVVTDPPYDTSGKKVDSPYDQPYTISFAEDESYIYSYKVTIDGIVAKSKTYATFPKADSVTVKLSDVYPESQKDKRKGWHQIITEVENSVGKKTLTENYVLVNPGPTGSLTAPGYTVGKTSNTPVIMIANFNTIVVPAATFTSTDGTKVTKPAVTVKAMKISVRSNDAVPTEFTTLGARQFRVKSEGSNYVYVKLIDSMGGEGWLTLDGTPTPPPVKIRFDQQRY